MIDLRLFSGQRFAVFGLGISGLSTALALENAGADVTLWDDNEVSCQNAIDLGHHVKNLVSEDFSQFDGLILSPGVPLTHPKPHWVVNKANAVNLRIMGDVELLLQAVKQDKRAKIVAVTGTNGKSTTVSLIHHVLRQAGLDAHLGGNIGSTTVLDMPEIVQDRIYVVELSSYQIDLMPSLQKQGFAPDISVLINVSADHIDRHGTIENYAEVKSQIFVQQGADDLAIIGVDDEFGARFAKYYNAKSLSAVGRLADIYCENGQISANGKMLLDLSDAPNLQGVHNAQNAAITYMIAQYFKVDDAVIAKAMNGFSGLEHRMELVGKISSDFGDILFINDSKATNAEAVKPALGAYEQIYWVAGGRAKQGGLKPLLKPLEKIKKAYLFGECAQDFAGQLIGVANFEVFSQMSESVNKALTDIMHNAEDGLKVILLSPAAASFDQFENFEMRGKQFKQLAKKLGAKPI
ncbi:MAG: UDP-N-acetylmuramoyl-L-alanine--D-glutamate ligase [Alphaproteobacteria bacterium]|nr:UDP-N-acetylmuramoyl-L-alanine--D-glutamate ligase [Alphaproteobacteria bacterium]